MNGDGASGLHRSMRATPMSKGVPMHPMLPESTHERARLLLPLVAVFVLTAMRPWDDFAVVDARNSMQWVFAGCAAIVVYLGDRNPELGVAGALIIDVANGFVELPQIGTHLLWAFMILELFARRPLRRALLVATPATGILVIAFGLSHNGRWEWAAIVGAVGLTALSAGIGLSQRSRQTVIEALRERAAAAENERAAEAKRLIAEDRLQTARDLHDSVAHHIAVISLHAQVITRAVGDREGVAARAAATISDAAATAHDEIFALLTDLRRSEGRSGQEQRIEGIPRVVDQFRRGGLAVDYNVHGAGAIVDPAVSAVVFRVVQEGLTNALKHGVGKAVVDTTLSRENVTVTITNGRALVRAVHAGAFVGGHGLRGLEELVDGVGGIVRIRDAGAAFELTATVPTRAVLA